MIFIEMISWWYSSGWGTAIHKIHMTFASIADFFSLNSLVRTLFKPYRQISAAGAGSDASIDMRFHMFIDRLISRLVGFCSRLILLLTGIIIAIIYGIISLALVIAWPFIPLLPFAGIVLSVLGVHI